MTPAAPLPANEQARLERLHGLALLDTGSEAVLDGFTRVAAAVTGMPVALLSLVDKDRQWFKSAVGAAQGGQTPRDLAFCAHAILQDEIFEVEDARADGRFARNPLVLGPPHVVHYVGAPLVMPGGERIGTLCLIDQRPGRLPPEHRALLAQLAANVVEVLLLRESDRAHRSLLDERNVLMEAILEHLPAGLTVFDRDLRLVASNKALRGLLDLPDSLFEQPDGLTFRALARFLAARGDYGPGAVEDLVQERVGRLRNLPNTYARGATRGREIEMRADAMPDGGVLTLYTDVTETRRAAAAVRDTQQRLALAMDAAQLGMWESDAEQGDVVLSGRWAGLIGLPGRVSLASIASHSPPGDIQRLRQAWRDLLTGASTRLAIEHAVQLKDGGVRWLLTEGQVTERGADGRARRVVGTCKDITQRRLADAVLQSALQAADEANRAKSDFLATMSHEIRTPINGVIGLTHLLSAARLGPRESGYVAGIDSCARSLLSLVDNILDFSKIEAGHVALEESATDLQALVREIGEVFTVRAAEKEIGFSSSMDPELPPVVLLDAPRLRQILFNLLGNAWKFTSSGGFSLRVGMAYGESGARRLRLAVTDTGIGIAADDQARLFTRFTQADGSASRRFQGTGLGLAISRDLARLMGGDVAVQSRVGAGSIFTIDLPLRPADAGTPERPDDCAALRPDAAILLVEDNEVNRVVAHGLLASLGYVRVAAVVNGREAVEACDREPYDLVLMDCQMPEMDGFQATSELRARGRRMPIVALTAHATTGDRERCLAAGMDDYLTKPVDPQVLARKLRLWLGEPSARAAPGPATANTPAAAPTQVAAFDQEAITLYFQGNRALYAKARGLFLQLTAPALQAMAAVGADEAAVRAQAHKIKGSAATMGAAALAQLCARVEAGGTASMPHRGTWLRQATQALDGFAVLSAQALQTQDQAV